MFEFREIIGKIEKDEIKRVKELLEAENLILEQELDKTFGLYDDDQLIATASIKGNTFRCIAVDEHFKGSSVINMLMTKLIQVMQERQIYDYALFTKPEMAKSFGYFGFSKVMAVDDVVLMRYPEDHFENYLKGLEDQFKGLDGDIGAIVMNGNPFTNGHRYLIERACETVEDLIVFVVEEDASVFSFEERFNLIKRGVSDLSHVHVIPSGSYIISQATFPGYFLNGKNKSQIHGQLDLSIFSKKISPAIGINKRFVGTEPYCENTNLYNQMMKEILPDHGIEVIEIERLSDAGTVVSASRIRDAIKSNSLESVESLLPKVTYEFLSLNKEVLSKRLDKYVGRH